MIISNKVIHLIWLGDNIFNEKYVQDIKKNNPEFKVKIWRNENFNFNENNYVKKCYLEKKWAFLSDYYRAKILYEEGGVYIDTDMKSIKPISDILSKENNEKIILGFEYKGTVSMGFVATNKEHYFFKKIVEYYDKLEIINAYLIGNVIWTKVLYNIYPKIGIKRKNYFIDDLSIYKRSYFSNSNKIFSHTIFLHKHEISWKKNSFNRKLIKFASVIANVIPYWITHSFNTISEKKANKKNGTK